MHWQYLTRTLAINIFYLFQTFINYAIYLTYVCTYTYTYIYTSICMYDLGVHMYVYIGITQWLPIEMPLHQV